ncbi:MAG: YifB family Mg chelatase-like AAA ATPase [Candidatus Puniceispirillaceae bacterium]
MNALIHTVAFRGLDTVPVSVQAHLSNGLPAMMIVGLADKAVAESKERIRAALSSMGLSLPAKRIAINLAPADVTKEGAHYDLPIALALLVAMGLLSQDDVMDSVVIGELSLDGMVANVTGTLSAALFASSQNMRLICPQANGAEAKWADGGEVIACPSLVGLLNHLKGQSLLPTPPDISLDTTNHYPDMAEVKGQETAKRVLEIAAAGRHHLLMIGPPGAGKSMLASRLPGLLPPLTPAEALQVSMIQSLGGQLYSTGDEGAKITKNRPYRDPHHSASMAALVGGGAKAKPGEISLAHHGVLFLDELPEFQPSVLDALRQPLETGEVIIARANHHIRYPARFQLVAAMNPCRCGYLADATKACSRAPVCGKNYVAKLSGPLLDRFDLIIDVAALPPRQLLDDTPATPSSEIANHVNHAIAFDHQRDKTIPDFASDMRPYLEKVVDQFDITGRGYEKIIRVARTIANLAHSPQIEKPHLQEALAYRKIRLLL